MRSLKYFGPNKPPLLFMDGCFLFLRSWFIHHLYWEVFPGHLIKRLITIWKFVEYCLYAYYLLSLPRLKVPCLSCSFHMPIPRTKHGRCLINIYINGWKNSCLLNELYKLMNRGEMALMLQNIFWKIHTFIPNNCSISSNKLKNLIMIILH